MEECGMLVDQVFKYNADRRCTHTKYKERYAGPTSVLVTEEW